LVLSQEPLQGKAILEQFDQDVQSAGFPGAFSKIQDYVHQRYLVRIRPQNVLNFGTVLVKALLKGTPPRWEAYRKKIIASLVAVRDRAPASWPGISAAIVRQLNSLDPPNRMRGIAFLGTFPDFWQRVENSNQTALTETIANIRPAQLADFRIFSALGLAEFRDSLRAILQALTRDQLAEAIAVDALTEFWSRALDIYAKSSSFRGSEANFRDFILPFTGRLGRGHNDGVLDAIKDNGQNWDAADTPELLLDFLRNTALEDYPTQGARDAFLEVMRFHGRVDMYQQVLTELQADGWNPPAAAPRNRE
jgi:hypothetical protein